MYWEWSPRLIGFQVWPASSVRKAPAAEMALYMRLGLVPGLAGIVGALNDLPERAAGLRRVDSIRIDGRGIQMIHFPAAKKRTLDVPFLALAVPGQDKRTFLCTDQDADPTHKDSPF